VEQISKRLFSWASILEPQAREQAERTAAMPFVWPHLALMPDAHHGKGATVGSVIPTLGAIIPAAVGVDIGCGMIACRTRCGRSSMSRAISAVEPQRCQRLVAVEDLEQCSKRAGHRGRHKPGYPAWMDPPELKARHLKRISRRFRVGQQPRPLWWPWKPRCPACRTALTGISAGNGWRPATVITSAGEQASVPDQYLMSFEPCDHQFQVYVREM
jgi:hypothetical protein